MIASSCQSLIQPALSVQALFYEKVIRRVYPSMVITLEGMTAFQVAKLVKTKSKGEIRVDALKTNSTAYLFQRRYTHLVQEMKAR
jgi:hypothetical protein